MCSSRSTGRRTRTSSCGSAAARTRSPVRSSKTTTRATTPASCGGSQTSARSPCAAKSCGVKRVEVGEQERGLGVLAVDHIRRERQVALDPDDPQLLRRGQRLGREHAYLVPEALEVLGDRDQIRARLERLRAEEDLHAPIIASALAHHPGGHAHHERPGRHVARDDRARRDERLLADLDARA